MVAVLEGIGLGDSGIWGRGWGYGGRRGEVGRENTLKRGTNIVVIKEAIFGDDQISRSNDCLKRRFLSIPQVS